MPKANGPFLQDFARDNHTCDSCNKSCGNLSRAALHKPRELRAFVPPVASAFSYGGAAFQSSRPYG